MAGKPLSSADYYKKATSFWNYPDVPYGPALKDMIRPTDVVADIGCGIGIVSRYLAGISHVRKMMIKKLVKVGING